MKLILLFLISFQSIQTPIDYYFDSSEAVVHILYDNKIEKYQVENDYQLISSTRIKNSNLYDLSHFKFLDEHQLTSRIGGKVLEIKGDSVFRIDNSYEHRVQMNCVEFKKNDTIIRYGGYGFFESRNFFTFFDDITNEWEIYGTKGDIVPERIRDHGTILTENNLIIFGGYSFSKGKRDIMYKNTKCYSFDFDTKKWSFLGHLNRHLEREFSFLYGKHNLIYLPLEKVFKINPRLNFIKEYYPNPITRKIESSFFKPFIYNGQIHLFIMEDGKLKFKSIVLEIFDSSLELKNTQNFYEKSYWVIILSLISVIVFVVIIFLLFKRFLNKIVKIKGLYFYNLKKISLKSDEKILFDTLYDHAKNNNKVENRFITDIFYDENLNYATINRRKNESINKLNNKLKIIFKTDKNIIIRKYSDVDRREIYYSINSKYI